MKYHYLEKYLMAPTHPITISVIGCGGTGSYVVTQLAKLAVALYETRKIDLSVTVYDNDVVEAHNVGRQLFSPSDIGRNKAEVIIERVNRFYGFNWESKNEKISESPKNNIVITCVDNVKTRKLIKKRAHPMFTDHRSQFYWLDFGNSKDYGQYVLSSLYKIDQPKGDYFVGKLKTVFELFGKMKEDKSEPSCSMLESLSKQDLFINLQLATSGIGLLWKLLTEHRISYQGQFLNLNTGHTHPILIK